MQQEPGTHWLHRAERLKACTHGSWRYTSSCSSPPLTSPWSPSLTAAHGEQEGLDAVPYLVLLPKANPSFQTPSTPHLCIGLPSMGSTGLPGVRSPSILGCSCPTQTAHPCLQRKEHGLVGATQGAGHQEDRAYCSTQPLNYSLSEKGTLKNVPSPDQVPGQDF